MPTKGVLIGPNLHKRQMKLLRWGEDRMGTDKQHRKLTPEILIEPLVKFELLEDLAQWSGDVVRAARKTWDPSADGGDGGYTVDCDDVIYVADYNEVGHNADAGGYGVAEMHERDNEPKWVGTIIDLCCPGDEQGNCGL